MNKKIQEIFLPAKVLRVCLQAHHGNAVKDWQELDEELLFREVGESLEHGWWHWGWLQAVRRHKCRLVVVQAQDAKGDDMYPQYQLGDLFTLSGWHPERALAEAEKLLDESDGDGLMVGIPADQGLLEAWSELADEHNLDEENALDVLAGAMILLDHAHDRYVAELGDAFYIATRGLERDLDNLLDDEEGRWSAETMQIVDKHATVSQVHIFTEQPEYLEKPVPLVYQPVVGDAEENEDDDDDDFEEADLAPSAKRGSRLN